MVSVAQIQSTTPSIACCDFQVPRDKVGDGATICAHTLEFPVPVESVVNLQVRGQQHTSQAPGEKPGLQWTSQYGFVGINALNIQDAVDGMNEKGLSVSALSLHGTQYPDVPADQTDRAVGISDLGTYLLGTCATVAEVEKALDEIAIWGNFIDPLTHTPMGVHLAIHDADGNNLVVEFIDGKTEVKPNQMGILTNDPKLEDQWEELGKYNHLSPEETGPVTINGQEVTPPIEGDSTLGLPGGWSSEERFAKIAFMLRTASKVDTATQAVNLALHVMNNVDRLSGCTLLKIGQHEASDITYWGTIKDLTHGILYFRSYDNQQLRKIDLNKLDFQPVAKSTPLKVATGEQQAIDVTEELQARSSGWRLW